jgi:hypothetical protein
MQTGSMMQLPAPRHVEVCSPVSFSSCLFSARQNWAQPDTIFDDPNSVMGLLKSTASSNTSIPIDELARKPIFWVCPVVFLISLDCYNVSALSIRRNWNNECNSSVPCDHLRRRTVFSWWDSEHLCFLSLLFRPARQIIASGSMEFALIDRREGTRNELRRRQWNERSM